MARAADVATACRGRVESVSASRASTPTKRPSAWHPAERIDMSADDQHFRKQCQRIERLVAKDKWDAAIVAIKRVLRLEPDNHWLLIQLSSAYYEQRKYKVALRASERAFQANQSCPFVIWHHSNHMAVCGRHREAISLVRKLMARGLQRIANGPCGEGVLHTRSLLNDCRLQLACWHLELGEKSPATRYFNAHLRGRAHAKSIYGKNHLKRLASQLEAS